MIRRSLRIVLGLGLLAGLAAALVKALGSRDESSPGLAGDPEPWPPRSSATPWVEPIDGACPTSHPVKAKLASQIFHLPGMANYDRTNPDRCYVDATQAETDGMRAAKR